MYSEKEILNALKILKGTCEENNQKCHKCILRNGNSGCGVLLNTNGEYYDYLKEWELKNEENPRIILN